MKKLAGILVLGVCAGLVSVQLWLFRSPLKGWPDQEFTPAAWKSLDREARYNLVRDLIGSGNLDGSTKNEVLALLGAPDYESPVGQLEYVVKSAEYGDPGFDSVYFLRIAFDESSQVAAYDIGSD